MDWVYACRDREKLPRKLLENLDPGRRLSGRSGSGPALEKPKWLVVTDRRIIISGEKILGRYEATAIPYEKLKQVYLRSGVWRSEFHIETEEGEKIEMPWMDKDAAREAVEAIKEALQRVSVEPPTIVRRKHLASEEWVLNKPKEQITRSYVARQAPAQPAVPAERREDPLEKLEKLKRLLDEGAITPEEYEVFRRRLLEEITGGES
ncbi:PH domain-containing protein [Pyrodictium abyssi]|uniref:PH domain-containing protein n=1 Tax=Pyrodictium abyssi TaxID=54256 RepID=A0ABM8IXJ9_9CREN|nr:PH domain-containing protein [Pyrodictium abyssi]